MRTGSLQDQRILGQPEDQNPIRFYMTIFMIFPFPAELMFLIFFLNFPIHELNPLQMKLP